MNEVLHGAAQFDRANYDEARQREAERFRLQLARDIRFAALLSALDEVLEAAS